MTLNYDNGIASLTHIIIGRTIDVAKGQHNFGKVKTTNSSFRQSGSFFKIYAEFPNFTINYFTMSTMRIA